MGIQFNCTPRLSFNINISVCGHYTDRTASQRIAFFNMNFQLFCASVIHNKYVFLAVPKHGTNGGRYSFPLSWQILSFLLLISSFFYLKPVLLPPTFFKIDGHFEILRMSVSTKISGNEVTSVIYCDIWNVNNNKIRKFNRFVQWRFTGSKNCCFGQWIWEEQIFKWF